MTEDEDKIDPARTELTIQRSLEKASERRVWFRPSDDAGEWVTVHTSTMRQAVDEIERLRGQVAEFDGFLEAFKKQNKALREEIRRLRVEAGYD